MSRFTINAVEGPLYDDELESHGAHFTQSSLYRRWQENRGLTVERFVMKEHEAPILFFQTITAPLVAGRNQIYIPHGPVALTPNLSAEHIAEFKKNLLTIAKVRKAAFVRLDPPTTADLFNQLFGQAPKLASHSVLAQPRYEWILDISPSIENIFDSFPKDTRYSIRTSEKRGTSTKIITENFLAHLDDFYRLMSDTAKRNHFKLHPKSYYEKVFIETEKARGGYLVVATFDDQPLVINLIVTFGTTALHIFGGSSSEHRDKLPSYLAHYEGIKEAKRRGSTKYSFGGVSYGQDQKESWVDLTSFKKNFPGVATDLGKLYDFPISRLWYYFYIIAKLFRK